MGVNSVDLEFLLSAIASGARFERCLMLGQQTLYVPDAEVERQLQLYGLTAEAVRWQAPPAGARDPLGIGDERRYVGSLLRAMGARDVVALDASAYDGADVVHDLNEPLPAALRARFDLVVDGGTLEHVFEFRTAIRNCMAALRPDGRLMLQSPTNGFSGHGFYQFSPELIYSVLGAANGFAVERLYVYDYAVAGAWYRVRAPAEVGRRVELPTGAPLIMLVEARKVRDVEPFQTLPQQSDYVTLWQAASDDAEGDGGDEAPAAPGTVAGASAGASTGASVAARARARAARPESRWRRQARRLAVRLQEARGQAPVGLADRRFFERVPRRGDTRGMGRWVSHGARAVRATAAPLLGVLGVLGDTLLGLLP